MEESHGVEVTRTDARVGARRLHHQRRPDSRPIRSRSSAIAPRPDADLARSSRSVVAQYTSFPSRVIVYKSSAPRPASLIGRRKGVAHGRAFARSIRP
jgi:hypothetical protein